MLNEFIRFWLCAFCDCLYEFLDTASFDRIHWNCRNPFCSEVFHPCTCRRLIRKISLIEHNNARFITDNFAQHRIRRAQRDPRIQQLNDYIYQLQILLDQPLCLAHVPRVPLETWNVDYVVIFHYDLSMYRIRP